MATTPRTARKAAAVRTTDGIVETAPTFAAEVGTRVGLVIAELASNSRRNLGYHLGEVVLEATNAVFVERPMHRQPKAGRQRVAGLAAVYYRLFLPPVEWTLLGAEMALGDGRVDLAWQLPDQRVLVDELKAIGYGDRLLTSDTRAQVTRYLEAGTERWGEGFSGVRLIALAAPYHSIFLPNVRERADLAETEFFFGAMKVAA